MAKNQKIPAFLIVVAVISAILTCVTAFFAIKSIGTEAQVSGFIICGIMALCTVVSVFLCQKSKTLPSRKDIDLDDDDDDDEDEE